LIQVNLQKDLKERMLVIKIAALYKNRLFIKEPKWKNLQELQPLIPPVCHAYKDRVGQQLLVWGEA
jgi:hypothetical protein